jgi:glycosyltransferase involved in cell wall biosynthesis
MQVLHVIPSLGPLRGGPSFALPVMARGLSACGVEVHIATTDDNGPSRLSVPLGRPVVEGNTSTWYFRRQVRPYTVSWPLTRWLTKHTREYDLLHIHALFSYSSSVAAWYAQKFGIPYIVRPLGTLNRWGMTQRRPALKRLSFTLMERRILAGAAAIHYTSEQEREEARALGLHTRAEVIPLGIELAPYEDLPSPDRFLQTHPSLAGRTIVLFMSRLDPKKGLDLLLPAFAQVVRAQPESVLVIAGDGPSDFLAGLRADVTALGLGHSVVFVGFLRGEDKLSALAACSVYVLPSYSENFGLAPVEAMAAGLPVVLSDGVGIARETQAAEAGLMVTCDVDAVASALQRLVADPDLRRILGQNARRLARERFSSEVAARRLVTLYDELLSPDVGAR